MGVKSVLMCLDKFFLGADYMRDFIPVVTLAELKNSGQSIEKKSYDYTITVAALFAELQSQPALNKWAMIFISTKRAESFHIIANQNIFPGWNFGTMRREKTLPLSTWLKWKCTCFASTGHFAYARTMLTFSLHLSHLTVSASHYAQPSTIASCASWVSRQITLRCQSLLQVWIGVGSSELIRPLTRIVFRQAWSPHALLILVHQGEVAGLVTENSTMRQLILVYTVAVAECRVWSNCFSCSKYLLFLFIFRSAGI